MGLQDEETGEEAAGGYAKNAIYDKKEVKNKRKKANLLING